MSEQFNENIITIFTDGASRGNPGCAGGGVYIPLSSRDICLSIYLGQKTNNEAEYLALLAGIKYILKFLLENTKTSSVKPFKLVFKMDSMLVVKQMQGEWKIKEPRMAKFVGLAKDWLAKTELPYSFQHIERDLNKQADLLANQAIDLGAE